jgi:uncharacterized protein
MFINIIKSYRNIVAICDAELIGKKFEEEKFQLDVKESFFKGELTQEKKALEIIKDMRLEDATFNIVGKRSVSLAIKSGIIKEEEVGKIAGIPYALRLL